MIAVWPDTLCFSADEDFLTLARATATHVAGLLDLSPGEELRAPWADRTRSPSLSRTD